MNTGTSIKQWAEDDRPRERAMRHGIAALSTAELLAILIGSGNAEENAVELMKRMMHKYQNKLSMLARADSQELCEFNGIGQAKALTIMAACELGRRRKEETEDCEQPSKITSSRATFDIMHPRLRDLSIEECHVILLNQALHIIDTRLISKGGQDSTVVDIRLVLREVLLARATSIILVHNHPSGNTQPSLRDNQLTARLQKAAATMDISLLDHLIIADGTYFSYADEGLISIIKEGNN